MKNFVYSIIGFINKKTRKTPGLRRFLMSANNRLGIIKNRHNFTPVKMKNKAAGEMKIKLLKDLKVAVILDEFSYNSFKDTFSCIAVDPDDWRDKFAREKPDLFLCESAWSGIDSETRPWQGKIYSSVNFRRENRRALLNILRYCRRKNIPTIFWNKEDPSHYADKVHNFVDTAIKFDHIFTTAEECVPLYKNEYGHKSVHSLMFATNPRLFNPIKKYARTNELIFAGSWYAYLKQRCIDIEKILDNAIKQNIEIVIYDRYYNYKDDENHVWPSKYQKYIRPSLSYTEVDKAYKSSNFALNFTSVTESQTTFARRVFELMSCRTVIVSNYSVGIEKLLGENVIFADENMKLKADDDKLEENLDLALSEHTYKNRFKQILDTVNYPYTDEKEDITFYFIINKEEDIEKSVETFKNTDHDEKKYVFVLSQSIENTRIKDLYQKYNTIDGTVISADYYSKYDTVPDCGTKYFMFADIDNLDGGFIKKALPHFSYIGENAGIGRAVNNEDKYLFKDLPCYNNIFCSSKLTDVFNNYSESHNIYLI